MEQEQTISQQTVVQPTQATQTTEYQEVVLSNSFESFKKIIKSISKLVNEATLEVNETGVMPNA